MAKAKRSAPKRKTKVIKVPKTLSKGELMERKNYHKAMAWNRCPCNAPESMVHWEQLERMMNEQPHLFSTTEARIIMERVKAGRENIND